MKRIVLVVFIALGLAACKKNGISPGLFGKWELHRAYGGGFAYFDSTYKAGNGNIIQFNRDSSYKQFVNNQLKAQGIFHIVKLVYAGSASAGIVFDDTQNPEPFDFEGTKLTVGTSYNDGVTTEYEKISN